MLLHLVSHRFHKYFLLQHLFLLLDHTDALPPSIGFLLLYVAATLVFKYALIYPMLVFFLAGTVPLPCLNARDRQQVFYYASIIINYFSGE